MHAQSLVIYAVFLRGTSSPISTTNSKSPKYSSCDFFRNLTPRKKEGKKLFPCFFCAHLLLLSPPPRLLLSSSVSSFSTLHYGVSCLIDLLSNESFSPSPPTRRERDKQGFSTQSPTGGNMGDSEAPWCYEPTASFHPPPPQICHRACALIEHQDFSSSSSLLTPLSTARGRNFCYWIIFFFVQHFSSYWVPRTLRFDLIAVCCF